MREPIRVTVAVDPHLASPNQRSRTFHKAARIKATMREAAAWAWVGAGKPRARGPVNVTVTVRRGRAIDLDNALASCKPLIDGLFNDAITPDDSIAWIKSYTIKLDVAKKYADQPEVEFLAEAV